MTVVVLRFGGCIEAEIAAIEERISLEDLCELLRRFMRRLPSFCATLTTTNMEVLIAT